MDEKRKFPRFPVTELVICSRYGRQMSMRTLNISRGGLKLEANFELGVGESMDFVILINGTRIRCRGKILAIEELNHRVHASLCFSRRPDSEERKLSDCLHALSRSPLLREVIGDSVSSLWGRMKQAMMKAVVQITRTFKGRHGGKELEQMNSWLELLPEVKRTVITLRFGLNGEDAHTLESTGKHLGQTPEAVHQIEAEAIGKLRNLSNKEEIYLEDIL
ncbi:MAG: PilZ domain-containing protein [Deltaproteobacteria bacterium]|nr:PilZ domain-containing protein [Deltaproteobacteria bacterium]